MTYPLVLRCMTNPDLPFTLRASFCLLMQYLYVDVEPYKTINFVSYTRVRIDARSSSFVLPLKRKLSS